MNINLDKNISIKNNKNFLNKIKKTAFIIKCLLFISYIIYNLCIIFLLLENNYKLSGITNKIFNKIILVIYIIVNIIIIFITFIQLIISIIELLKKKKDKINEYNGYVILNMNCYTESKDILLKNITSLINLKHDNSKKLIFIIADGNLYGKNENKQSWKYCLDILTDQDYSKIKESPLVEYNSLGYGINKVNKAKVFSGKTNNIPFVLIVKYGNLNEKQSNKPGNRGKIDSQMILFKTINKFFGNLEPLYLEINSHIYNIISIHLYTFEYLLLTDADTTVTEESIQYFIHKMEKNTQLIGCAGNIKVKNINDNYITKYQNIEYKLGQAIFRNFESKNSSVLCLPGAFSFYRIKDKNNKELVINSKIILTLFNNDNYNLHKKQCILCEDRFLVGILKRFFPELGTKYSNEAIAYTIVPNKINVLISQRKRWINSSFHTLYEEVKNITYKNKILGFISFKFFIIVNLFLLLNIPGFLCSIFIYIYSFKTINYLFIIPMFIFNLFIFLIIIVDNIEENWKIKIKIYIMTLILFFLILIIYLFLIPYFIFKQDDFSWGKTRKINKIVLFEKIILR